MATGNMASWVSRVQGFGYPCWTYVIKMQHDHIECLEEGLYKLCGGTSWNMLMQLPHHEGVLVDMPSREELLEQWSPGDGHAWAFAWSGYRAAHECMQRRQWKQHPDFSCWSQAELGDRGWHVHLVIGGAGLTRQNAMISRGILCTSFFKHLLMIVRERMHADHPDLTGLELAAWQWLQGIAASVMRGDHDRICTILRQRRNNGTLVAQPVMGPEFITRYLLPKNRVVCSLVPGWRTTPGRAYEGTWTGSYGFTVCNGQTVPEQDRRDIWQTLYNVYAGHPAEEMLQSNPDVWRNLPRVSDNVIDQNDAEDEKRPIKLSRKQRIMTEVIRKATDKLLLTYNDLVVQLPELILMLEGMPGGSKTSEQLLNMIHITLCNKYNAMQFMLLKTPSSGDVDFTQNLVFRLLNLQGYNAWQLGHWLWLMLSKRTGKRNSCLFYGPASTGKTNIVKAICHAVGLYGCVNHNNKQFPFNDAPNKMLLWWEEAVMTTDYVEAAKCILGGTHVRVDVKHKDSRELPQMPVLLSSNHDVYTVQGGNATYGVHAQPLKERITQVNFMKQLENTFGEITPGMASDWLDACQRKFSHADSLRGFQETWKLNTVGNSFPLQSLCSGHSQNWIFNENGVCGHCGGYIQPSEDSEPGDSDSEHTSAGDSGDSSGGESALATDTDSDSGLGRSVSTLVSEPEPEIAAEGGLEHLREEVERLTAWDIQRLANAADPRLLEPIPELEDANDPEEGPSAERKRHLDPEDTEPQAPEGDGAATKKPRLEGELEVISSDSDKENEQPLDLSISQPVTEWDWHLYEERMRRRRAQRQSEMARNEERRAEDVDMEVDPGDWGERMGVVPRGPDEEPLVLHCFEDMPDSEEEADAV